MTRSEQRQCIVALVYEKTFHPEEPVSELIGRICDDSGYGHLARLTDDGQQAAENIAGGQPTPSAVVNSWMNSSGHRANILDGSLRKIGVGYARGGQYGTYWVQLFTG